MLINIRNGAINIFGSDNRLFCIEMHLVPGKLSSFLVYLYDASLTRVRLEIPKHQIVSAFIPSVKSIARLSELKIV